MEKQNRNRIKLNREAIRDANHINMYIMFSCAVMSILSEILNEIGIFNMDKVVMRITISIVFLLFISPFVIHVISDHILKKEDCILYNGKFRYAILIPSYIGIGILCTVLTYQTIILLVLPPLMTAQYKNNRRFVIIAIIISLIMVPVTMYLGYFFGLADRNLLKAILTEEEQMDISKRMELASWERMGVLAYHYMLPRLICVGLVDILTFCIAARNDKMIKSQIELSDEAANEMEKRNLMQSRVIEDLAAVIETRDSDTGGHIIRTKKYVNMILNQMQKDEKYKDILTDEYIMNITNSAPLHDVGKIAITDRILLKPGRLDKDEFEEMKKHSSKGGEMIKNIFSNLEDKNLSMISYEIALSHHEKWDGTGYPNGLKGEDIPLPARVMAVADVYDAITSKRVYKDSIPPEEAFEIIVNGSGTQFDPDIIRNVILIKQDLIDYVNNNKREE